MIPCAASILACARDCATSWGHSRWSKPSDVFISRKAGSCGSAKRDMCAESTERPSESAIWATWVASAKPSR